MSLHYLVVFNVFLGGSKLNPSIRVETSNKAWRGRDRRMLKVIWRVNLLGRVMVICGLLLWLNVCPTLSGTLDAFVTNDTSFCYDHNQVEQQGQMSRRKRKRLSQEKDVGRWLSNNPDHRNAPTGIWTNIQQLETP